MDCGCPRGVGRVCEDPICSGLFRVSTQENSHVRQTPNNPQTNANTSACGAGTYSGEAASTCTTCGAGTYSGEAASVCNKCQAGTYSGVEGATAATTCQGKYVSSREPQLVWVGLFWGGRGWIVGVRGVWAGCARIQFVRVCSACQHKKTHTYVKPQIIHKQTPTPQHVGREPTLGKQRRHARLAGQEHTPGRQLQYATCAKREPILE